MKPRRPALCWRSIGRQVVFPVLDLFLPSSCATCGDRLGALHVEGICPGCWATLPLLRKPTCPGCGLPIPACTDLLGPAEGRCGACTTHPLGLDRVVSVVAYRGIGKRLLLISTDPLFDKRRGNPSP